MKNVNEPSEMDLIIIGNVERILGTDFTKSYYKDTVKFIFNLPFEMDLEDLIKISKLPGLITAEIKIKSSLVYDQNLTQLIIKIR